MALPKLGELLGANEAAAAAFDERAFADALTDGLATRVAPALQPVLEAIVDRAAARMPDAMAPLLKEIEELRTDLQVAVDRLLIAFAPAGLTITVGRKPEA